METVDDRSDLALGHTLATEAGATAGDHARLPTGAARYVRGRELGRGGMGRVVEAVDLQFKRTVAVKEVAGEQPPAALVRRFTTEAIITGNLEHPGIPSVYERGVDPDGRPFYAMHRVQGRSLAHLLAEADTRDKRLALLAVVTRAAQTVGFAHDRGVIHRDIKPDNIMVGDHGETYVVDWGVARVRGVAVDDGAGASSGDHTAYGAVVGTPAYMAPEQASGDLDRVDERTDVFSLGALLYHVITGLAPYRGDTNDVRLEQARAGRIGPIAQPGIPPELAAICARATAREPSARYRNAHELARALAAFEASAVVSRSPRLEAYVNSVAILMVVGALAGLFSTTVAASNITEQGVAAWSAMVVGLFGCVTSAIEWRTRGRLQLGAYSLGFAVATFFVAVGGAAIGIGQTFEGLADVADERRYRYLMSTGIHEVIGGLGIGAALSAFQLALWGAAKVRTARTAGT